MNLKTNYFIRSLAALTIAGGMAGSGIAIAQDHEEDQGMEVLTRGPVHEGFAETVVFDPTPGIIIDREPPELIEEVLPEQRPVGDNVAWIPGYWGWEEDQDDFIWISGVWRNLPPGRQWIPGYWAPLDDGNYQWTSGYWEDEDTEEVTYIPEPPPRSLETGPNVEASSSSQSWVPGNWQYQDDDYAWRAGYWVDSRPDWTWTPSYYRYTPRGYVYVDGYWDYPVRNRGVVFAPVRFERSYISRPNFSYSPLTAIALSVFSNHLFVRPSYGHYYFGDYYEPRYRNNYYASYSYASRRRGYDPIFAHYRYENRNDRNWVRDRQRYFEYRRDNSDARPPRTWAALNRRSAQDRQRGDFGVAERYDRFVKNDRDGRQRFQSVNAKERERFASQKEDIRGFTRERRQQELAPVNTRNSEAGNTGKKQPNRVKVKKSPLGATKSDRSEKDGGPPARLRESAQARGDVAQKPGQNNKGPKAGNKASDDAKGKPKNTEQTMAGRKNEPAVETRTKPGQRRDAVPNTNPNKGAQGKPSQDKGPSNKAGQKPDKKTQEKPENKGKPTTPGKADDKAPSKRQADPAPNRQGSPDPKRQAAPNPKRQADSTPKRQAEPAPTRKTEPAPKQKAQPAPRQKAQPAPKQKAGPAPQRKAEPAPQKKSQGNPSSGGGRPDDRKSGGPKKDK